MKGMSNPVVPKSAFTNHFLETSGEKIAYFDSGGNGFPLIFIHGNSCSSKIFKHQLAAFRDQFRVICIDLPGHGNSPDALSPENSYTIPGYAKLLNQVANLLKLEEFVLIGFSMGGNIALQWSQLSEKIRGILLVSGAPIKYSEKALDAYPPQEGNFSGHSNQLTKSQATQFMRRCGFNVSDPSMQFVIEDAMRTDARTRATMVSSIFNGSGVDEVDIVRRLKIPLAIIVGENDSILGLNYLKNLDYSTLWKGQINIIPQAKHAIIYHQANQLNSLVHTFLQDLKLNRLQRCQSKIPSLFFL